MLNPADEASYFSYNLRGDMTVALNGRGNPTYFGYDAVSRLASETDGIGDSTYYAYDPAGHLTDRLDGEGRWVQWSYDGLGRRVATAYQDGAYAYFTFDAAGRAIAMRDTWGESQYEYDSAGRLVGRRWPDGRCVYYEYDAASNVTALTGPDGGTTYYQYGPLGRMESIHTAQGGWAYYDYDPAGHCIRRQNPNGTLAYFSYDAAGRISSLRNLKGDMSPLSYFDYLYDEAGLATSIAREGGLAIYYGYDAASRLTGETWQGPAGALYAFAYGYDPAGNRAWKDIDGTLTYYTYDAAERLLHEVSEAKYTYYSYDKNGSCVRVEAPDQGKYTYFEYSDARLLRSAHVLPEGRWNYFHYDGQLTRYCIQDSQGCQYYYWDGLKLLQRDNLTIGASRTFTHGHTPIAGIANMVEYAEADEAYDFHYDIRGTVHGITDADQEVAQTYEHDAWGVKLSEVGSLENPIQYRGCRWIAAEPFASPTFLSPSRAYDGSAARFLQRGTERFDLSSPYASPAQDDKDPCERHGLAKGLGKHGQIVVDNTVLEWCCMTPAMFPPDPEGKKPKPCEPSDLRPVTNDQTGDACTNEVLKAWRDANVLALRTEVNDQRSTYQDEERGNPNLQRYLKLCTVFDPECRCCSSSLNPGCRHAGAFMAAQFKGDTGEELAEDTEARWKRFEGWKIYVCEDLASEPGKIREAVHHEMVHILQRCSRRPSATCPDVMQLEVQAYEVLGWDFKRAFEAAVWSSCMRGSCDPDAITLELAVAMMGYFQDIRESPLRPGKWRTF